MSQNLNNALRMGLAIESLLNPFAEVVIHDLKKMKIHEILNSFSKRKKGDPSLLPEGMDLKNLPDHFPPYFTTNWDGRQLKSTTATIRNEKSEAIGLLCINLDVSKLTQTSQILSLFASPAGRKLPQELFCDDPREKIHDCVLSYLREKKLSFENLTPSDKKSLIRYLDEMGAFRIKNAATLIGRVLNLSRASVYNYLGGKP